MCYKESKNNYLIFSDLDGTLLDHETYSFDEAKDMLEYIKKNNIPLILVTSKTKEEVIKLQEKLDISYPFIVENGAGIFIPQNNYELIALGKLYAETLKSFDNYSKEFDMTGFSKLSVEEIARLTNLPYEKASLAKMRTFSEPFILNDESKLEELKEKVIKDGFDIVKGGRFYHLITFGQDKAKAIIKLKNYYEEKYQKKFETIALGDGQNDITMLNAVNHAVLIRKYDGTFIDFSKENLIKSEKIGPAGWNESLKAILCKQ